MNSSNQDIFYTIDRIFSGQIQIYPTFAVVARRGALVLSPLKMSVLHRSSRCDGYMRSFILISLLMKTVDCTPSFRCPEVVELGSSMNLTCCLESSYNATSYLKPAGGAPEAMCLLSGGKCIPNGNAFVINNTCSVLIIPSVLPSHGGDWKCVNDTNNPRPEACHVTVVKIPGCNITSDRNTSSLNEGDKLTLTVSLSRLYCSESSLVVLTTGRINTTLISETTQFNETIQFNVTSSHFGEVSLTYSCSSSRWNVSCEGLHQLGEGTLPDMPTSSTQSAVSATSDGSPGDTDSTVWIAVGIAVVIAIVIAVIVYMRRNRQNILRGYHLANIVMNAPVSEAVKHNLFCHVSSKAFVKFRAAKEPYG